MKLKLKASRAISLTKYPGEETTTQVLVVSALLTPPVAEALRIREGCYNEEGVPRRLDVFPSPHVRIEGADVGLGGTSFEATLIHKFKVAQPKTGGDQDTSLEVRLRLHFDGKAPLSKWLDTVNKGEFVLAINARQEDLDFGDSTDEPEEEVEDGPGAVSTAREAAGGTHQKRGRGRQLEIMTTAEQREAVAARND